MTIKPAKFYAANARNSNNQAQEFSCFSRRHYVRARFHSCNSSRYFDSFISEFIATAIMIHFLIPFFSNEFRKCRCISLSEFHSILFKDVLNSIHISTHLDASRVAIYANQLCLFNFHLRQ